MPGTLYVVATPLGNLDDLSPRALETLRRVDVIACEDTRRTGKLLARYAIERPVISCHRFNERQRLEPVLVRLRNGENVALVADAGTPGVADPGALLVRAALEEGVRVCPIPGPSAAATLLSASGLPADRYVFEGFLPHRVGERRRRLRALRDERRPVVIFETPHRLAATLADIDEIFGARRVVLGRELTKLHETILVGTARDLAPRVGESPRGEFTLVLEGADDDASKSSEPRAETARKVWRAALAAGDGDRRAALKQASRELGMKRAELYRYLTELGEDPG